MYDKYRCHEVLTSHGLPSPPTVLPGTEPESYPVMVKPRQGSGARSIHPAADRAEMEFFVGYVKEPVMVQRLMGGHEFSIDVLCDLDGVCLNAIPRTMLESRGGESIKGQVIDDPELVELARTVAETLRFRGPGTIQVFRDPEIGIAITDVNPRFGGAFAAPMYAALPGRTYPELIVRMAAGERIEPHVGEYRAGDYFTPLLRAARARLGAPADGPPDARLGPESDDGVGRPQPRRGRLRRAEVVDGHASWPPPGRVMPSSTSAARSEPLCADDEHRPVARSREVRQRAVNAREQRVPAARSRGRRRPGGPRRPA